MNGNNMSLSSNFTEKPKQYLREIKIKLGLERANIQEEVLVEALLASDASDLVISLS